LHFNLGLRVARVRVGSALPSDQTPLTIEQRKALEWVLAIGGKLHLQAAGKDYQLKPGDAIPDGLLTIITIDLGSLQAVDDDTVENLKALPTLSRGSLSLRFTHVGDAG